MQSDYNSPFELILFHTYIEFDAEAIAAGVHALIVDWERRGKETRQAGFDTQINLHTVEDLYSVRLHSDAHLICRLNGFGPWTSDEIAAAINNGADEILVPMIRSLTEVEQIMRLTREQCAVSIMVETSEAVALANSWEQFPLSRVYLGLNDLSISRGDRHLFVPVSDGTVERTRNALRSTRFGFCGLTLPDKGSPIPCHLLIAEMARLQCQFSFLRRSFIRDVRDQDMPAAISAILQAIVEAQHRSYEQICAAKIELVNIVKQLPDPPWI